MEDSDGKKSLIGVTGVLLVGAAIGGYLWVPPGLKSFRPSAPQDVFVESMSMEDVSARLWQDPFRAVLDHRHKLKEHQEQNQEPLSSAHEDHHKVKSLARELADRALRTSLVGGYQIIVMPVMVPGGQYSESVEERRRQRYAVIAALGSNGLVPENDQSVGFLKTRWTDDGVLLPDEVSETDPPHIKVDVPFEWYRPPFDYQAFIREQKTDRASVQLEEPPTNPQRREVLVLWLNESQFGQRPFKMVSQMADRIVDLSDTGALVGNRIRLAVIGPANSTSLNALLEEVAGNTRQTAASSVTRDYTNISNKNRKGSEYADLSDDHRQIVEFFGLYLDSGLQGTADQVKKIEDSIRNTLRALESKSFSTADKWAQELINTEKRLRTSIANTDWISSISDSDANWIRTSLSLWRVARLERLPFLSNYGLANSLVEILALEEGFAFHSRVDSAALQESLAKLIAKSKPKTWQLESKEAFLKGILEHLQSIEPLAKLNLEAAVDFWSDETLNWTEDAPVDRASHLEFFSSRATIWPELLTTDAQRVLSLMKHRKSESDRDQQEASTGISLPSFTRTISNDRQLIDMLLVEFHSRSMNLSDTDRNSRDHVALIGELDTHYGRAFPAAFRAALCQQHNLALSLSTTGDSGEKPEKGQLPILDCSDRDLLAAKFDNVHQFQYLRGIDGLIPGDEHEEPTKGSKKEEATRIEMSVLQRPDGRSQLDYVSRLCDQIAAREREQFPSGLGYFKVIGVVGSDVYDKQLILQALRARFPRTVFFTTDLDARLTHSSQYHWSRNLLIASSFGLTLNQSLQRTIPPFRGSYQTSTFLACQLALGLPPIELHGEAIDASTLIDSRHIELRLQTPRLYEVARDGAYDISHHDDRHGWTLHASVDSNRLAFRGLNLDLFLSAVCSLLLFSAAVGSCYLGRKKGHRTSSPDLNRRILSLSAVFLVVLTILVSFVHVDSTNPTGEPFELFQGVSVWPTELLRFTIGFICLAFLLCAICQLHESNEYLEKRYAFFEEESETHQAVDDEMSAADIAPDAGDAVAPGPDDPPVPAKRFWRESLEDGRRWTRATRISVTVGTYLAFTVAVALIFGPPISPVRSLVANHIDREMIGFSTLAMAVLAFFVLDTNRLCARMIEQFKSTNTSWPRTAIERVKLERGLEEAEANEWLEVQFIAERTAVVGRFVVLPFVAFFFLLIARNSYFDLWLWPFSLMLVFCVLSICIIASGLILRRAAEASRRTSLLALRKLRSRFQNSAAQDEQRRAAQIELTIEELKNLKTGAFAPWSQHPLVRAVILPFGGAGTVLVLEILSKLGM